jgi:hypothetical protein
MTRPQQLGLLLAFIAIQSARVTMGQNPSPDAGTGGTRAAPPGGATVKRTEPAAKKPNLSRPTDEQAAPSGGSQSATDREYDLNIASKKIVEPHYTSSASVSLSPVKGVGLWVGWLASAEKATISLREVHGHVRVKGSLDQILEGVKARLSHAPHAAATLGAAGGGPPATTKTNSTQPKETTH